MQIIIDIPEEKYTKLVMEEEHIRACGSYYPVMILDGTPLPKGHGRLIDADKLLDSDGIIADSRKCHYIPMIDVYQALTIIEADKEKEE